jgi:hypothetical protein
MYEISSVSKYSGPLMLSWLQQYGRFYVDDERKFEFVDPTIKDKDYFLKQLIDEKSKGVLDKEINLRLDYDIVCQLVQSLGRVPTPLEVKREKFRQQIFKQIDEDEYNEVYLETESIPREVIKSSRIGDFPDSKNSFNAFKNAKAKIECVEGIERLILEVPNSKGHLISHPVMTNEELPWVKKSADIIARIMKDDESSRIFIAGLGLGLLNKELIYRGVQPERQFVVEINSDVINKINTIDGLDIVQDDFKCVLDRLVYERKLFKAVSIDPFPNNADEINCDASSEDVLSKSLAILELGGLLTFYPDSYYVPKKVCKFLNFVGVPNSSIHYTVANFNKSSFTEKYYYGDLMAVVHIQKPLIDFNYRTRIQDLVEEYYSNFNKMCNKYCNF